METQQFPVFTGKRERPIWRNVTSLPPTEEVARCIKTMVYPKGLTSNHNTQRGEGNSLSLYQEKDGADGNDFQPTVKLFLRIAELSEVLPIHRRLYVCPDHMSYVLCHTYMLHYEQLTVTLSPLPLFGFF